MQYLRLNHRLFSLLFLCPIKSPTLSLSHSPILPQFSTQAPVSLAEISSEKHAGNLTAIYLNSFILPVLFLLYIINRLSFFFSKRYPLSRRSIFCWFCGVLAWNRSCCFWVFSGFDNVGEFAKYFVMFILGFFLVFD